MTRNEKITIVISFTALLLSGLSYHSTTKNVGHQIKLEFAQEVEKSTRSDLKIIEELQLINDQIKHCLDLETDKSRIIAFRNIMRDVIVLIEESESRLNQLGDFPYEANMEALYLLKKHSNQQLIEQEKLKSLNKIVSCDQKSNSIS